jgi:hypothetical protein
MAKYPPKFTADPTVASCVCVRSRLSLMVGAYTEKLYARPAQACKGQ